MERDLPSIAYADYIVQFMKLVFLGVAVCPLGPRKDECQRRMATLEESTMLGLRSIMADVPRWAMPADKSGTESPQPQGEHQDDVPKPPATAMDSDLFYEAQAAELRAENSKLRHDINSLRKVHQEDQNKYSRLQDNYVCTSRALVKKMLI